jgi:hypothetical protein
LAATNGGGNSGYQSIHRLQLDVSNRAHTCPLKQSTRISSSQANPPTGQHSTAARQASPHDPTAPASTASVSTPITFSKECPYPIADNTTMNSAHSPSRAGARPIQLDPHTDLRPGTGPLCRTGASQGASPQRRFHSARRCRGPDQAWTGGRPDGLRQSGGRNASGGGALQRRVM